MQNTPFATAIEAMMASYPTQRIDVTDPLPTDMLSLRNNYVPILKHDTGVAAQSLALSTIFKVCQYHLYRILQCSQNDLYDQLEQLYIKKNHDYGNSWAESLDEDGILVAKIRLREKITRIYTILDDPSGAMVPEESVAETLRDICNYCVLTYMWLNG